MSAYDQASIQINRCKRILALVDLYVEKQTTATRTDLRKALMDEFEAPAIAPPRAAGSVDTCAEMRALCSACGGTGDVHRADGEWLGQCTCIHGQTLRREQQAQGEHPAPCARSCEAPAFQCLVRERDARIAQLEAQLMRRRTPLSPETHQAIAAARAAGQTIAATSAGLIFMNDGTEPGGGELDCPACGGSGHAGDVVAGSTS
ncbi:hypothetical protein [Janthinobacterium sp.]|uniref:hypothetical protein n=1 Tax=Janthinobacterium sp. TaxID=1871054 RepID=UPI002614520A|nr:hypothetical protein [Janthinobacterium sp.]